MKLLIVEDDVETATDFGPALLEASHIVVRRSGRIVTRTMRPERVWDDLEPKTRVPRQPVAGKDR